MIFENDQQQQQQPKKKKEEEEEKKEEEGKKKKVLWSEIPLVGMRDDSRSGRSPEDLGRIQE